LARIFPLAILARDLWGYPRLCDGEPIDPSEGGVDEIDDAFLEMSNLATTLFSADSLDFRFRCYFSHYILVANKCLRESGEGYQIHHG
jgi:hypothetical protein